MGRGGRIGGVLVGMCLGGCEYAWWGGVEGGRHVSRYPGEKHKNVSLRA